MSNRNRKRKLLLCTRLLGVHQQQERIGKEPWQDLLTRLIRIDPRICPYCGKAKSVLACSIHKCEKIRAGESEFCWECADLPCRRLKRLDAGYRERRGYSALPFSFATSH